jgi:hypothetical protein
VSGAQLTVVRADVQPWPEGLDATLAEIRHGAASAEGEEPMPLAADIMRLGEALHAIGEAATVRVGSMEWKYEPALTVVIVFARNPAAPEEPEPPSEEYDCAASFLLVTPPWPQASNDYAKVWRESKPT